MTEQTNITEDEAALYDRQIRLWGLDAQRRWYKWYVSGEHQRRLRSSSVLLIGVGGLGAEVAKNIVLSGVKSLTLLDHAEVGEEDASYQFLVSRSDIGKNRAVSSLDRTQLLNPMVEVHVDQEKVSDKEDDFFTKFNVICATRCEQSVLYRISDICEKHKIQFFAGDVFGQFGYMFTDLHLHEYAQEVSKPKSKEPNKNDEPSAKKQKSENDTVVVKKVSHYTRLKNALEFDWSSKSGVQKLKKTSNTFFITQVLLKFLEKNGRRPLVASFDTDKEELLKLKTEVLESLKVDSDKVNNDFAKLCFSEFCPVSAIVGGVLGQEIIKAVSQKDQPHNNFFFFNGLDGLGIVDQIGAPDLQKPPEEKSELKKCQSV